MTAKSVPLGMTHSSATAEAGAAQVGDSRWGTLYKTGAIAGPGPGRCAPCSR